MTKAKLQAILRVTKLVVTNRVTYRFLVVLLAALGVHHSEALVGRLEALVCTVLTQCS